RTLMFARPHLFALALIGFSAAGAVTQPPDRATDEQYRNALLTALHRLSEKNWDAEHLSAFLDRNPNLVNGRLTFREPHKPGSLDHYTALHFAAAAGNAGGVKVLLHHKADVNADSGGGWTPLHHAARGGHLEVVKLLIAAGAKPDAKTDALPERAAPSGPPNAKPLMLPAIPAYSALDLATAGKHAAVVEYLKGLK
ncbi:MAG: ankyrin repeat domain-containing protein, partial [Gemmataceae bacterium]|nr:ankyrin repeat domain-containing protein [Gemmataceae bacterium]